ncbi:unnamed protein product, partial [Mesorhabditis spiculigera]
MPCFLAGVDAGAQSAFLISQVNTLDIQQIACFTAHSSVQKCDLLDAKFWPKIGDAWHVTALWSDYSSARHTPYRLHHTVIGKARLSTLEDPGYSWRSVSICNSNAMYHTHDATLEKLQEMVYNTDLHNIEVVARAVQVVCQGKTFDARYDWKGLRRFVEMYAQTPEFDERFDRLEGKLTMYKMIVEKCAELEAAVNNPIRIFRIDSPLSSLWGIVRHGALTMVTEAPAPLLKIITRQGFGPSSRQLADLVEYTEIAAASAQEEEDMDDDCAKICETAKAPRDLGRLTTCVEALLKYMEEMAAEQKGNVEERSTFGGAFTDNLLSAILRRRIRAIQSTTHNLSHFFLLVKSKRWDTRQHERFNKLYNQANQLTKSYRLLNDQLTDRILGNDAYMSLCTWVIHFGLPLLCAPNSQFSQSPNMMEGSEDGSSSAAQIARPHDVFLQTAVEGLLSMLIPSNKRLSLLQMIAKAKDYALLKKMIDLVEAADSASSLSTSTPIGVTYFRAIAFSGSGRPDKALAAFEQCIPAALSGDPELAAVLFSPAETAVTSSLLSRFFLRAIELLSNHGHVSQVSCLALQASMHLKNGDGPRYALERIHIILFTQQVDGGEWGMALETIRACQNSDSQRGLLESMVFRLLSLRAWKLICSSIPWREFTNEVACLLFDKASAMSPKESPNIFELLASFYAARFDNYNAANSLYEWAQRLAELPQDPPMYAKRRDILAATSLYLSMNTENRRSYLHARSHKGDYHRKKTQTDEFVFGTGTISTKVSASMEDINEIYNSDELFQSRFVDAERVKREWSILDVRVLLCRELPQCIPPPNDPEALLMLLLELRRFDHARVFACIHGLPVDGVFQMITKAAIEYDCDEDPPTNWVLENPKFVSDRGTCDPWNIVKGHLEAHMQTKNSIVSPLCVVLNTMLEEGYPNVHPWLHKMFMKTDVGSYLVTLSNYTKNRQVLEAIIEYSGEMFKQVKGIDSNVVLPYCALDLVLKRAQEDRDREVMTFYTKAVDSVKSLQSRIQAFEAASKFTQKSQPDSRISFMS